MLRLYADTSALISLARTPQRDLLVECLTSRHLTQVSVVNIAELAQAKDPQLRNTQLEVALRLSRGYKPLARTRTILTRSVETLAARQAEMNWSLDDNLDGGLWVAINSPELVDEPAREEVEQWVRNLETHYREMHLAGR